MKIFSQRVRLLPTRTDADLYVDGVLFCHVLEDKVREIPGRPVFEWKIHGDTAVPACIANVTLVDSPHFGPDTIALNPVPGYKNVLAHEGNTEADTEGCQILGFRLDPSGTISPGTSRPALARLKARVKIALALGEKITWEIRNPPGYTGPVN